MSNLWNLQNITPVSNPLGSAETIPGLFWNAVELRRDQVWLREKYLGIWRPWAWQQVGQAVREIAMGLASIDFEPGQCASVLANTVVEWVFADLGVQSAGGVCNGIYPTDSESQVEYLCSDSSTTVIFVEDEEQLDKVLAVREKLPLLRWIIVFDMEGLQGFSDPMVMSLDALREKGRAYDTAHSGEFERRLACRGPKDLAILIYTSGTTGKAKGAMHSHGGLVYAVQQIHAMLPQNESDTRMCVLPLCHVAERVLGAYYGMYSGTVLSFVESPDTLPENVREIAPTIFFAVPRVWEKFYSAVTIAVKESSRLQQTVYGWAIGVGRRVADKVLKKQPVDGILKIKFLLARLVALNNVRKMIGIHRARILGTGAAPISPDLIGWYLALGLPMLEGWAQTESGALGTWMRTDQIKPGTIGRAAAGTEVRVDPASGELLIRAPSVFMGYLNQPEKTAETIDTEGWLHTGDVGSVDDEGFFRITDRMKDIIITAGGKNITPSELENQLKFSPYITDAVVIGDKRAYLTALIMIDHDNVEKFAQDNDVPFSNYASLTRAQPVLDLIEGEVERVNKQFARVEQIKTFRLIDQLLTAEDDELTPTMKLKRKFVHQKYAGLIESMYQKQ